MKILIIGSGGREHAIAWKIKQSRGVEKVFCAPGNGGISDIATCVDINAMDFDGLVDFAKKEKIDLTIVGPDDCLVGGIVDKFEENGLKIFGPRKNAAIIEGSKAFSKEFMKKYNIPTASYSTFDNIENALEYLKTQKFPIVIKADGLALGKGVIICENLLQASEAVNSIMAEKKFGNSGNKIVIEEFLTGPEVSVLAFCDGKTIVPMVGATDHKRALDNDQGLNTGGMGTFSPSKNYTDKMESWCMENIYKPTVQGLLSEGREFKGIIFFGLMITSDGPKVIEYNARFGDPETQVVLPRLNADFLEILLACENGTLDKVNIKWDDCVTICVILASGGYPEKYENGYKISGIQEVEKANGLNVFHAGVEKKGNEYFTKGGRVLGVVAKNQTLQTAFDDAYNYAEKIEFTNKHFRTDIGKKEL